VTILHGLFLVSLVATVAGIGWLAWMFDRG
jgi:nitrate reductase NapE component